MLVFALIFPFLTTVLLAVVVRKAGFGAIGYLFACGPLIGAALPHAVMGLGEGGGRSIGDSAPLVASLAFPFLSLAPLVFLAIARWPVLKGRA